MKKQIKTAFIIAFAFAIIVIAGTIDGDLLTWHPRNYISGELRFRYWLPMWMGFGIGFAFCIGRDER